jgi:hypothetical protein
VINSLKKSNQFRPADVVLIGVFCAVWAVLNRTLGPVSVGVLGVPVLHDFAVFFTLLLAVWATGKAGVASLVGMIGSLLALAAGMPFVVLGFAAAAVVFDAVLVVSRHKIAFNIGSVAVATAATLASAYLAGAIIGVFILGMPLVLALSIWAMWHLVGGIFTVAVTLLVIRVIEKANVRVIRK